jgi:hypothetical protein
MHKNNVCSCNFDLLDSSIFEEFFFNTEKIFVIHCGLIGSLMVRLREYDECFQTSNRFLVLDVFPVRSFCFHFTIFFNMTLALVTTRVLSAIYHSNFSVAKILILGNVSFVALLTIVE